MTREQLNHLRQALVQADLPVTINSEAGPISPNQREKLDRQVREAIRGLRKVARAWLEEAEKRLEEDDTIVPPDPEPVNPWPALIERGIRGLKMAIAGTSLGLHLVQGSLLVWLALEVMRLRAR
jgi:hypothetical protein